MPQSSSRNVEREARLKSGASERTDEAILQRVTQPGEEVIKRTTFAVKTGEVLTGEAQTR